MPSTTYKIQKPSQLKTEAEAKRSPLGVAAEVAEMGSEDRSHAGVEFSFSASGWLFVYQLGVATALRKQGLHLDKADEYKCHFVGSSGGSLVSSVLALDIDILPIKDYFLECVAHCKSNPSRNMFKMREYCEGAFQMATDEDTYKHPSLQAKRLNVSVTLLPSCENAIIDEFHSAVELKQAILASCTMSPLAGLPFRMDKPSDPRVHGKWVFDGGLSHVQPATSCSSKFKRVTCSPFYFWDCDIKPSKYVPVHWGFYPPSVEEMDDLFNLGVTDCESWLKQNEAWLLDTSGEVEKLAVPTTVKLEYEESLETETDVSVTDSEGETVHTHMYEYTEEHVTVQARTRTNTLEPDGMFNNAADSFAVFAQKSIVKPIALSAVYVELSALASISAARAAVASVEGRRREKIAPSRHLFSIRRWIPEQILGTSQEATETALHCVKTMMSPMSLWRKLHEKPAAEEKKEVDCDLTKHSRIYRGLHALSLM